MYNAINNNNILYCNINYLLLLAKTYSSSIDNNNLFDSYIIFLTNYIFLLINDILSNENSY